MNEIVVEWIDSRAKVNIYDVIDALDEVERMLRTFDMPGVIANESPSATHIAYMEGTLDGVNIVSGWLRDEAVRSLDN